MYNSVETLDDRYNFLTTARLFEFVNFYTGTPFIDKLREVTLPDVTYDNKNFKPTTFRPLY